MMQRRYAAACFVSWLRFFFPFGGCAPVYLLDLALLGVPFVCCCVAIKRYNIYSTFLLATAPYVLLYLLLHALSLGLLMAMFIDYTRWRCCWLLGQGCFRLWLGHALSRVLVRSTVGRAK